MVEKQKKKRHKAYRKNGRMANINPTLSVINIYVNRLNTAIRR